MKKIISSVVMVTTLISVVVNVGVVSAGQSGRSQYAKLIGEAIKDPQKACKIHEGVGSSLTNINSLYAAFKKLEKNELISSDDRVLYYLICGDVIQRNSSSKYEDLFDSLTRLQRAAPVMRTVLAALKHPKVSCAALGLFGRELENLSDTTKALICQACFKNEIPDDKGRRGRGMFEQTGDWKAISAVCGQQGLKKICTADYRDTLADADYRESLSRACAESGKSIK